MARLLSRDLAAGYMISLQCRTQNLNLALLSLLFTVAVQSAHPKSAHTGAHLDTRKEDGASTEILRFSTKGCDNECFRLHMKTLGRLMTFFWGSKQPKVGKRRLSLHTLDPKVGILWILGAEGFGKATNLLDPKLYSMACRDRQPRPAPCERMVTVRGH